MFHEKNIGFIKKKYSSPTEQYYVLRKIILQVHVNDIYSRSREYSSPWVESKINENYE